MLLPLYSYNRVQYQGSYVHDEVTLHAIHIINHVVLLFCSYCYSMAVPDYTEEKEVLFNYYPSLCSTLTDIDPLLPRFVAAGVISAPHGFENIKSQNTILKRVQELLSHISGPLQDGNTAPFYSLLEIMEQHSTQATRKLAEKMRSDLRSSVHINFPMNNHGEKCCNSVLLQCCVGLCNGEIHCDGLK